MANFSAYYPILLDYEGNYCHYPTDPGGETYRGIARTQNGTWSGWPIIDAAKKQLGLVSPVPRAQWAQLNARLGAHADLNANIQHLYQARYWDKLHLSDVHSQSIANQLADHGVNAGTSRPAKMLQFLLNTQFGAKLVVDGTIGPQSIATLNAVTAPLFYLSLVEMRRAFYYYRAGSPLTATPNLPHWADFLRTTLGVVPDPTMKQYLPSWLSRTQAPFVS